MAYPHIISPNLQGNHVLKTPVTCICPEPQMCSPTPLPARKKKRARSKYNSPVMTSARILDHRDNLSLPFLLLCASSIIKRSVKLRGVPEKPVWAMLARKLLRSPSSIPLRPSNPPTNVLNCPREAAWAWTSGLRTTGIITGLPLYDPRDPA